MRKVYLGLSGLLMLALLLQFYFAAVGAFARPQQDDSFAVHDMIGMVAIPLLAILATIAAAVAKAPGRLIGLTILPLGLVILQVLIVELGRALNDDADATTTAGLIILGLHAINGLALLGVGGTILRRARLLAGGTASPSTPVESTRSGAPTA